jgi:hypothetical protein
MGTDRADPKWALGGDRFSIGFCRFKGDLALNRIECSRPPFLIAGSVSGHEDQFLPLRLSARSVIRKQTVAATRGNGRDAP